MGDLVELELFVSSGDGQMSRLLASPKKRIFLNFSLKPLSQRQLLRWRCPRVHRKGNI